MSTPHFSPDAEAGGASHPLIGRTLGRFRIAARLGQGGVATVWKAHDELLGRPVALKILHEHLADSPKVRRRFLHDAQAAALLDHPGVITVYDAGEAAGMTYIALSLVDGETLSEHAAKRLMPIAEAVRIVRAAAAALGHAHARGVIHRDVTGRNIMIGRDGRVIVLDFGLARAVGMSRLTSSNAAMGTAAYMAPEMIAGDEGDARTDLYGLGVVLYEALTGTWPFSGDRPESVVFAALHQAPRPPRACRPEIPPALEAIVLKAIARRPDDRYDAAEALIAELDALDLDGLDPGGGPAPPAPVEPAPPAGAADTRETTRPLGARDATRPHPVYLAVLPFQLLEAAAHPDDTLAPLAQRLAGTVSAALARRSGVRVIAVPDELPDLESGSARMLARSLGANALMRGTVSRAGVQVRVTWTLLDPWRGVQFAGDVVDGSVVQPFDLEDHVVESVARALELPPAPRETGATRPPDPAAAERLAKALAYLKRYDNEASVDGAIALLDGLLGSRGAAAAAYAALARACLFKHRLTRQRVWESRAAAACERAIERDPDAPETRLALGDLQLGAGRAAEALAHYEEALATREDYYEARVGRARALAALQRLAEAERECAEAIAARPDDWRAYSSLGGFLYQGGHYAAALEPWRHVVRLTPDNAMANRNLGSAYFHLDRFEDALAAYADSLHIQPTDTAYTNLGTVLYYLGRYDEAVEAFEKAVALTPTNPLWWGNLGNACRWIPGRASRAREALDRAILLMRERLDRSPADADSHARLAGWLAGLGAIPEALEHIARALTLAPADVEVMECAGHVYFAAGRRDEALRWLGEAVRLGYGRGALRASPEFAPLRDDPEFRRIVEEGSGPAERSEPTQGRDA